MSIRTRTPSLFRPHKSIDQGVLTQKRALLDDINRRNVLRGAVSLGALSLLTGCDVSEDEFGAKGAAHGVGVERSGASGDLPAAASGADL